MKKITAVILFLVMISISFAGAWTQKKGSGYYKVGYRLLSAEKVFGPTGDKLNIPKLTEHSISLYGEYGLNDQLSAILSFQPYKMIKSDAAINGETENNSIGDLSLGLKAFIAKFGQTVMSGFIQFGIPTGDSDPPNGLITGDGEFNQFFGLQLGHSLYPMPAYFNFTAGFNNRNEGYSDEFYTSFEAGYKFTESLMLIGRVKLLKSLKNGDNNFAGGYGGLYSNNQEYVAYGPELIYKITDDFGVSAHFESGTAAKNIQSAPVFGFGVFFTN